MDPLRASSNFLNIHGAWVLGGLIAAGLIKHKSNQKKQRAESFSAEGGRKYRGIGMKPLDHPDRGTLCDVDGCMVPFTNVRRTFGWVIRFCDQHQKQVDSTYKAEWEETEIEVKLPGRKCQSCGYVEKQGPLSSPYGLQACPQCDFLFGDGVWVLSTIDTIIDPTLQLWRDPGDSLYGATVDAALHKVGYSIDKFPDGVEIEIGSIYEDLLYADQDDYDSKVIGFAEPAKVKLFNVPGDMFDSWEYTDGEITLRFGSEGDRINFLMLEQVTEADPSVAFWKDQCVVKIGGDAPEIEIEDDARFVKIDGHQYDIIEDEVGYYAEDDDTTPILAFTTNENTGIIGTNEQFIHRYGTSNPEELKMIIKEQEGLTRKPAFISGIPSMIQNPTKLRKRLAGRKTPVELDFNWQHQWGAEESDNTTPTPKNPCPRCEGAAGFPKEFYFHPKRLDFIPCRNCIEMGGYCPGCMEVLPGMTRDRDPWEAFYDGCGKCGWSWDDATAIRPKTTQWSVHLDHPGAQRWFSSEQDAYAYAYNEGHRDSRVGSPYKPMLAKVNRDSFRNIVRQKAESFSAEDTKKCQRCDGTAKMVSISAKCSDLYFQVNLKTGKEYDGYVPDWIGTSGDYVDFTICRHCGQVQGEWPELDATMNQFKSGKATTSGFDAEDDECSVCDGLGWRYVEDDDGESVRAPCYECGGGSSTGSPTGVVAYDAERIGGRSKGKKYLTVEDLKQSLKNAKDTDRIGIGILPSMASTINYDGNYIDTNLKRIYRQKIALKDYLIIVGEPGGPHKNRYRDLKDSWPDLWNADGGEYDSLGDSKAHPELHKRDFIECEGCSNSVSFAEVAQGLGWSLDGYCDQCVGESFAAEPCEHDWEYVRSYGTSFWSGYADEAVEIEVGMAEYRCKNCHKTKEVEIKEDYDAESFDADTYDRATHGPYLPVGAVKRFLARMPAQEEFFVTFVKSNSDVRDMHCFLTRPYDPDNDVAGVMELGGPRAIFKRFRTDRVISIYR